MPDQTELSRRRFIFPFFDQADFAGVPSQRLLRPKKNFEATIDRAVGEQVRADGACGVELWSALAGIHWHSADGAVVSYTSRQAAELVAWVREEGDALLWYCSGPIGDVASWISAAWLQKGDVVSGTLILFCQTSHSANIAAARRLQMAT